MGVGERGEGETEVDALQAGERADWRGRKGICCLKLTGVELSHGSFPHK